MGENELESLYKKAVQLEAVTNYELNAFPTVESKRKHLVEELNIHKLIGKREIIKLGEILKLIKRFCGEDGTSFESYLKANTEISPRSAENYINVYSVCSLRPGLIENIKLSILYEVCSPGFDKDLLEYFFSIGILNDMEYKRFKAMMVEYKAEGFRAIQKEAEKISNEKIAMHQVKAFIENAKACLKYLKDAVLNLERSGSPANKGRVPFYDQIENDQPFIKDVKKTLYDGIKAAEELISKSITKVDQFLKNYAN
jgi:hypothetical protein